MVTVQVATLPLIDAALTVVSTAADVTPSAPKLGVPVRPGKRSP